ncbi:MAG: ATP-binding protein [Bdellovibrionota bacterium]
MEITQFKEIDEGNCEHFFKKLKPILTKALNSQRVSIWLFNSDRTSLVSESTYDVDQGFLFPESITRDSDPLFFLTVELGNLFIDEKRMISPFRIGDDIAGIVLAEKKNESFSGDYGEQRFFSNVGYVVARSLISRQTALLVAELKEEKMKLDHSHKMASLGEMAGGIAHEINNPLTTIRANSDYLIAFLKGGKFDQKDFLESLEKIQATSMRIEKIIKGLRFFARDARQDERVRATVKSIIDDTLSLCQEKFRAHACKVILDITNEDIFIQCQTVSLSQAILNLMNNAFDVIKGQKGSWIRLTIRSENGQVIIQVSDSGPGIPENIREKIMQPFFSTKPVGKGTGLGLAIVKGIVEHHDGKFYLEEKTPHTTFTIILPEAD